MAAVEDAECTWVRAHEILSRLARERAAADAEEGRWLLAARRSAAHVHLGFASFSEYIERLFGYTPRTTLEKLRVAEALEELPRMARALETGSLNWSAARELTRVAIADTERQWLDIARGKTLRQLEELVAGKHPGDEPSAGSPSSAGHRVLRFEVTPETFALFREALASLRQRSGEAWDDDAALLSMARHVLGGPADDGRASYQVALTVCPTCRIGQWQASGELVTVGADVVAMAECDAQHLGPISAFPANETAHVGSDHTAESPAMRATTFTEGADFDMSARTRTTKPHRRAETADAHVYTRAQIRPADRHRSETADTPPHVGIRAKQTIPPALRRTVLLRDQHRCRVPGCRNARFVDVHHIALRSEGGRNELANLITMCGAHHRATHRGQLVIENSAHGGVRFRHADGTDYGQALQPRAFDMQVKLFSALRGLGFREREVRAVLAELRQEEALRGASIEQLLREALRRIPLPGARRCTDPAQTTGMKLRCNR